MVKRSAGVGLAFAAAAVAASGLLASNAFATYPGANGRIAFVGSMPGCSGICTVQPNGSGLKQLSSFGDEPSWSANGRRIVFSGRWIHTMKSDGTNKTKVPSTGGSEHRWAAFSPSGRRIVYNQYRPSAPPQRQGALYTIRTDGTGKRQLVTGADVPETPSYSPSGRRIVFAGAPADRSWGIWTIRRDGTGLRAVTTNPNSDGVHSDHLPDWSPDGKEIEFIRYDDCDPRQCWGPIKFIRPDGSGMHGKSLSGGGYRYLYAPSGDRLVSVDIGGDVPYLPECSDIFTEAVDSYDRATVTDNCANYAKDLPSGFAWDPSWQPLPSG